jgi:hypothetical protein
MIRPRPTTGSVSWTSMSSPHSAPGRRRFGRYVLTHGVKRVRENHDQIVFVGE